MSQYLNRIKSIRRKEPKVETKLETKESSKPDNKPVLDDEDEKFLQKLTSEGSLSPAGELSVILDNGKELKGRDAQTALMDGADKIPLPTSPPLESPTTAKAKSSYWSKLPSIPFKGKGKGKEKEATAADLKAAADAFKNTSADVKPDINVVAAETKQDEEADLSAILDQLNLAAVNNRVFSFSKESQELLDKFKLVLKDIVLGVPTAYDDLEKLLTGSEKQLTGLFGTLPPFLQSLVKSLPSKMSAALAPEVLAAASEKPGADAFKLAGGSGIKKRGLKPKIPSLKSLVGQQGAVATMLKTILNFLKLRFPVLLTGTNVLMSLAVFLLLFVFWYCHKRGREVRMEREKSGAGGADGSESEFDVSSSELEESGILSNSAAPGPSGTATVADMPSVLDLPDPKQVPLPTSPGPAEKADFELRK